MKKPGLDHDWSVGTELRQLRIFDDEARCREKFRQVLADEVKRRHYIIDAEVKVITNKTCVSSMILSASTTVPPIVNNIST